MTMAGFSYTPLETCFSPYSRLAAAVAVVVVAAAVLIPLGYPWQRSTIAHLDSQFAAANFNSKSTNAHPISSRRKDNPELEDKTAD